MTTGKKIRNSNELNTMSYASFLTSPIETDQGSMSSSSSRRRKAEKRRQNMHKKIYHRHGKTKPASPPRNMCSSMQRQYPTLCETICVLNKNPLCID